jgi:hypothetical protein
MFRKGTRLIYRHNDQPAYEKLNDDEDGLWVALNGFYLVKEEVFNEKTGEMEEVYVSFPETDLPLYKKDGNLNRTGFKLNDKMVMNYFKDIMDFEIDAFM